MEVKILKQITLSKTILHPGEIINIPAILLPKLGGRVEPLHIDARNFSHYCEPASAWCSEKLPGKDYPAGCIRIKCEYHQENQA